MIKKPAAEINMHMTLNFLHDSGIPPHSFSGFDIFETPYAYVAKMIGPRIIVKILKFNLVSSILSAQNIQLEVMYLHRGKSVTFNAKAGTRTRVQALATPGDNHYTTFACSKRMNPCINRYRS